MAIWRMSALRTETGKGRSANYDDIRTGLMVPPVKLGLRAVGFPDYEVRAITAARIAGKTPEQIRRLVADLIAARKIPA